MRAKAKIKGNRISKRVEVSPYLFSVLKKHIKEYWSWLGNSGLKVPDTKIMFDEGIVTFDQELLSSSQSRDIENIIGILKRMNFDRFGIDSNPRNFIGGEQIYFVDFFPFLVRDQRVLSEQFDYPVETVLKRYFTRANVITSFINRIFKEDFQRAMGSVERSADLLISEFNEVLPREKERLLKGIEVAHAGANTQDYINHYDAYKRTETITVKRERKLKDELRKFKKNLLTLT